MPPQHKKRVQPAVTSPVPAPETSAADTDVVEEQAAEQVADATPSEAVVASSEAKASDATPSTTTHIKRQKRIQVTLRDFNGSVTVSSSTAPLKKPKVTIAPDAQVVAVERKARKINADLPRGTIRGLFIGSARVRKTIYESCLNREVYEVCQSIEEASKARTITNKKGVERVEQTRVEKISEHVKSIYKAAESAYLSEMTNRYVAAMVKVMKQDSPERYAAYKAMKPEEGETDILMNKRFDNQFYDKFEEFYTANDRFGLGKMTRSRIKRDGTMSEPKVIDEWHRAIGLIRRTAFHMSANSSRILAAFLDQIADELCRDALVACIKSGHKTVTVEHSVSSLSVNTNIQRYVQTLLSFQNAVDWLSACEAVNKSAEAQRLVLRAKQSKKKEGNREHISVKVQLPVYPKPVQSVMFNHYIIDVFRAAKFALRDKQVVSDQAELYFSSLITGNFRDMVSFVVFETTERISNILQAILTKDETRTVTDANMYHAITMLLLSVGIAPAPYLTHCRESVKKFTAWHATNCDSVGSRMKTMTSNADDDEDEEESSDEEVDADVTDVEVAETVPKRTHVRHAGHKKVVIDADAADDE